MRHPGFPRKGKSYQEDASFVYPSAFAAILIFLVIIIDILLGNQPFGEKRIIALATGLGGSLYVILQILLRNAPFY